MTEIQKNKMKLNRKHFLGIAWFGALLTLFGEFIAGLFVFIQPDLEGGFGGIVNAGKVELFSPGSVSLIQSGRFYLIRYEDGGFIAYWQRCTHLGCSVPYDEDLQAFRCPCHGSVFDELTGEVGGGPAPRPLDTFPIEIREGEIFVDTGDPQERTEFSDDQVVYG
ncbi:MAG TPA: Rieske (2Fe-2S) protein [Chloroflexi bacterium]|nr:Rieske (2Fe-2S) protein [Chloroflexota bacterium]